MHLQVEVDYYSNVDYYAKKKKIYKLSVKSINKKQLKDSWRSDCTGHCTCNDNLSYFVAWIWKYFVVSTCCYLKVYF